MSTVQIQSRKKEAPKGFALFNLGFRPFFLGASFFASISMFAWMCIYFSWGSIGTGAISPSQWHAHEMVYGYCMAVIAGFLLTAIPNWTGIDTISGIPLAGLTVLWLAARISFLLGDTWYGLAAVTDLLFIIVLIGAIARPIFRVRQWKQMGILSKVVLLFVGNTAFYLDVFGYISSAIMPSIYGGLYLVLGLILTIAGRVFPGFIENLVPENVTLKNPKWLSGTSLVVFLVFAINQIAFLNSAVLLWSSVLLTAITTMRLVLWHTPGIWRQPMLWSLYLSLVCIDGGFLLFALSATGGVSPLLAVHALAAGSIGLVTMGMMARVILGHTGRNIRKMSRGVSVCFLLILIGACFRVVLPLMSMSNYFTWIFISQCCWIVAFLFFGIFHLRMLVQPRIDGKAG